ncbi:hypothetical protein [Polaribacter sp. Hel1_85]|uniref:hypothetical protein n=1 Tax=Polaribacter sp. Hel1_85 TaxID=1250005 RepID=UPI00052CB338|nr:hypothetical protein [Polaribacter sp. Hel1_85]KGL62690.1 hypothetical protein PHEL85_2484 [Polaribacter sp. Hel1_85]
MAVLDKLQNSISFLYKLFDIEEKNEISIIEEAEDKIQLPDEYLERFTLYAIQNKDFLKNRDEELRSLELAFDNWKIVNSPLLVVNDPGEGGTSLLHASTYIYPTAKILETNQAIDSYKKLISILSHVLRIDEEFKTLKELEKYINNSEESHVLILENIERLFIRRIRGFDLLEDFLLFLHATKSKIYWIISINKYSFYYLNRVKYFSSHFPSIIHLKPISNKQLKEEILNRNNGYDLVFLKPNKITNKVEKQLKKVSKEERQSILEKIFFKRLYQFSKGNITKAILYARNSAYNVKGKTVFVKPIEIMVLDDLSLNDLFILEAIFQHRSLSIKELNIVLRNSDRQSRLSIEKLLEKQLIRPTTTIKGKVEYRINLMFLDILKDLLKERLNRNFR